MKCHRLLSVVAVLSAAALARAEQPATTNRLQEVVVTATRIPSETENTPTAATVIRGEEMERQQIRMVFDALRQVPGVNMVQPFGYPGSVFIRGANSDQSLVLVDGVRVNNGFQGGFDFSTVPMDNIERIEVLRGPQSTLYGSEAMGGVINIITKRGAEKPTGAITFEGGSYDSIRPRVSFTDTIGKLSLSAAGSYFSTDNDRINSAVRQRDMNASVGYKFCEHLDATVSGWYRSSHAGSPGPDTWNDPDSFTKNENVNIAVVFHAQPMECWDARLTLSHNHDRLVYISPPTAFSWYLFDNSRVTTDREQIDFQNVFTINDKNKLLAGMSFDNTHVNRFETSNWSGSTVDTLIAPTIRSYAGYGSYEFTPFERMTFNVGGRVDSYSNFGSEGTYRTGLRYTVPVTETILRANFGSAFHAPSLMALYYPDYSNPNLQPERSLGWDVGFEQPLLENKLRIGASYFQNEFNNLIEGVTTNFFPFGGYTTNINKAATIGCESFTTWTPVTNLLVRGAYTWLPVAEDQTAHQRLVKRPRHSGNLSINYHFLHRFDAMLRSNFVGEHQDSAAITTGGYVKLDVGLSCDVCKYFTVFGRVENITDEHYAEVAGYPALGRTFWAGGTVKF